MLPNCQPALGFPARRSASAGQPGRCRLGSRAPWREFSMRRALSLAACASIAATLAAIGSLPALAQTLSDSDTKLEPPAATAPQAQDEHAPPPAEAQPAPAPAVVEIDPMLAEIRQQ